MIRYILPIVFAIIMLTILLSAIWFPEGDGKIAVTIFILAIVGFFITLGRCRI